MLTEARRPGEMEIMLQAYRQLLASKPRNSVNSNVQAGPVTLGVRLSSSKFPAGYEVITYGRGTWLIHMLREMFRDASRTGSNPEGSDEVFLGVLRSIYERYQGREITNADFQAEVEAVLPKSLCFYNPGWLDCFSYSGVTAPVFP